MARKVVKSRKVLAESPAELGSGTTGSVPRSKSEAIRWAISAGYAKPQQGSEYIKSAFGLDVTPQHFSARKSQMKSTGGGTRVKKTRLKQRKAAKRLVEGYLAPPARSATRGSESELIHALEAVKPLVASLGADKVKRLVDLLS